MAQDIDTSLLMAEGFERQDQDFTWLSPTRLPYFLAQEWHKSQDGKQDPIPMYGYAPKQKQQQPAIVMHIHRRVPGKGIADAQKPSYRSSLLRPSTSELIEIYSQYQTVVYEFILFHTDYNALMYLVEEFENFLYMMQSALQERYVENFLFEEQVREDLLNRGERTDEVYSVVLRYKAYLQKKYELSYATIDRITSKIWVANDVTHVTGSITRDPTRLYDPLPMDRRLPFLKIDYISKLSPDTLQAVLYAAESSGGVTSLQEATGDNLYIKEQDYLFDNLYYSEKGQTLASIIWLNREESRRPNPNEVYYFSVRVPQTKLEVNSTN
jgi:hypothetical protein